MNGNRDGTAKPRILWMDLLRGVGLFLIILLHSGTILDRFDLVRPDWMKQFNDSFAPFRIPMLMFLSGLLLSASIAKPAKDYFAGKIRNIAYPYVVWTLIYAALIGIPHSWYNPKFWAGPTYLWYLLFLFINYICAFVLRDIRPAILFVGALIISILLPDGSKYGERLFFLMAFFFLGYFVSIWPQAWERVLASKWLLALSPLLLGFSFLSAIYGPFRYQGEFAGFVFIGIVVLCVLANMAMTSKLAEPFIFIGRNGIVFYVTHYLLIYFTMAALAGAGVRSAELVAGLSILVALAGGFLVSMLASRLWPVRLLFVGPAIPEWPLPRRSKQRLTG